MADNGELLTRGEIENFIGEELPPAALQAYLTAGEWGDEWQCPQDGLQRIYWEHGAWHQEWLSYPVFAIIKGVLHHGTYINYGAGDEAQLDGWYEVKRRADLFLSYTFEQQERDALGYIAWVLANEQDPLAYFAIATTDSVSVPDFALRITLDRQAGEAWVVRQNGEPISDPQGEAVSLRKVGERWSAVNAPVYVDYAYVAALDTDGDGLVDYDFGEITYSVPKSEADCKAQLLAAAKRKYGEMRGDAPLILF